MGTDSGQPADVLVGVRWQCASSEPGLLKDPADVDAADLTWREAVIPGTAASAFLASGEPPPTAEELDGKDWWFRCAVDVTESGPSGRWLLDMDGVATLSDVWVNGMLVVQGSSMFAPLRAVVDVAAGPNELLIRCAALTPVLEVRRPRPRWKSNIPTHPNLRWLRTSLLGRQVGWTSSPPPVGPWRGVRLWRSDGVQVVDHRLLATCELPSSAASSASKASGSVSVSLDVLVNGRTGPDSDHEEGPTGSLMVAGRRVPLMAEWCTDHWVLSGSVTLEQVELWWPHGYGPQPLTEVWAEVDGTAIDLGRVGFRTVIVDRSDDGFAILVNGVRVFCRGANWFPLDPVRLYATDQQLDAAFAEIGAAGWTMVRIPGGTVYEDERFWSRCDEGGVLVWQDLMVAQVALADEDDDFVAAVVAEAYQVAARVASHPSLAVLCGGQQIEEQGAMQGVPSSRWRSTLLEEVLPAAVAEAAPGVAWVTSSPSGGDLPFRSNAGVSHYAGVGPLMRPLTDLRLADVRFVTESLAFAVPPEPEMVDRWFGGAARAVHDPTWRMAVHRDALSHADLVDVTDHYVGELFGVEASEVRQTDPARYLELSRAVAATVMERAAAEWRRPGSPCSGFLAIARSDLAPGPGWGVVDASGQPKSSWYPLARASAPFAVLCTDEGVNGLDVHLVNDGPEVVEGTLVVGLHTAAHCSESASIPVRVPAQGSVRRGVEEILGGFRDVTHAFRFGPRVLELVTADVVDEGGSVLARGAFVVDGPQRTIDPELGLQVAVEEDDGGRWLLTISCHRFAHFVHVRIPGYSVADSWFPMAPRSSRVVALTPHQGWAQLPRGTVGALNAPASVPVVPPSVRP